jgi:SAM-dependent methyltransferase
MQPRMVNTLADVHAHTKDAWTAFWQEPGQSHCLSGAHEIGKVLADHWSSFAVSLKPAGRVLDLGCGAGAVGRLLLPVRRDVFITGIDFARIPLAIDRQVELLADTAMECLPFADGVFGAVVSQFGYEYSDTERTAREMARVLGANARFSLVVHHAGSSVVATNRARLDALAALFSEKTLRSAFCAGDADAFNAQMSALVRRHPRDALIATLAQSLPLRMSRAPRERAAV